MATWAYKHKPGDVEVLEVEVDPAWLGAETLTSITLEAPNSGLSLGVPAIEGSKGRLTVTDGTPGTHPLTFTINTPTRRRTVRTYLTVR